MDYVSVRLATNKKQESNTPHFEYCKPTLQNLLDMPPSPRGDVKDVKTETSELIATWLHNKVPSPENKLEQTKNSILKMSFPSMFLEEYKKIQPNKKKIHLHHTEFRIK